MGVKFTPSRAITCPHCGMLALSLEVNTDQIYAPSLGGQERDPNWRFVDSHGHVHTYQNQEKMWEWVVDYSYWCDFCRDDHDAGEFRCKHCGDEVTPGTRKEMNPYIAGEEHRTLQPCGHELSIEEFEVVLETMNAK